MSLKARIGKLERDGEGPSERLSLERILMVGTGEAEATPTEAEQLDALFREVESSSGLAESIDRELERLIAEIPMLPPAPPVCGLREIATQGE